jgi:hypothetical protein
MPRGELRVHDPDGHCFDRRVRLIMRRRQCNQGGRPGRPASNPLSVEPHPELTAELDVFAPLIGSWDLQVTWLENDVPVRQALGEWHFARVLEGRAVQDIWIVPPRSERSARSDLYEYGTCASSMPERAPGVRPGAGPCAVSC